MRPRSESRRKVEFYLPKASLLPSENKKRKTRGERVPGRGVPSTTVVDVDGDLLPPPKEWRTRKNTDPGS